MPEPGAITANVAAHIQARRKSRDWTAADVAEQMTKAGVPWDRQVVGKLENGRRRLLVEELAALACVFGIGNPWELTQPPPCDVCAGSPPAGFRCNTCDRSS